MNQPSNACWKIGSLRIDTRQGLVFREGEIVPLKRKAIQILTVLVENHGQLVEKEQLLRQVWPDSFVEEGNLTVHIWQLRKTLGEDGGDFRIETVPRRGYRLIGVVEREEPVGEPPGPLPNGATTQLNTTTGSAIPPRAPVPEGTEQPAELLSNSPEAPSKKPAVPAWLFIGLTVLLLAALVALSLRLLYKKPASNNSVQPEVAQRDRLVVGEIRNETGDTVFDATLRDALEIQLEQSPYLSLISDEHLQESLQLMGKQPETARTPELLRDLCQRNGGAAVVDGSIAKLGAEYVLGLKAVDCRTGDHISDLQTTAATKESVLAALGDLTARLRAKLGESLSTMQKFDTPIEEASTASLEALHAYSLGRQTMVQKGESAESVSLFQRAVRFDPDFAIAYAALGNAYSNIGETQKAADNIRKAYELRSRLSEHERLYIESHYEQFVTGDLIKASQIYDLWAATFPNDEAPRTNLAVIDSNLGRFDRSLELAKEAVHIATHDGQSYANLVSAYISLNDANSANAVAEEAKSRNLDSSTLRLYEYDLAYLQHNADAMQKQASWAAGEPGVEDAFLDDEATALGAIGQIAHARELTARAVDAARHVDERETAAGYELNAAQRDAEFGMDADAQHSAERALALAKSRDTEYAAAFVFGFSGATTKAQALAAELDRDYPSDTLVQRIYLPAIRAALAIRQNKAADALQALQPSQPYELGVGGELLPVYLRGLACLEAHDGAKAVIEFQKILDHPGVVLNAPIGPLAHLQMGRAYRLQGSAAQARAAYEVFFRQWKNADSDIPILRAARSEYTAQWGTPAPE